MQLLGLFWAFLKLGIFSFGGGHAMIALMQEEIILKHQWITQADFIDVIAISESTPGPIAVNLATFVGYKVSGILGSIIATISVIIPSFIIITIFYFFIHRLKDDKKIYIDGFFKGLRTIILGMILAGFFTVAKSSFKGLYEIICFLIVLYLSYSKDINPIILIFLSAVGGILFL